MIYFVLIVCGIFLCNSSFSQIDLSLVKTVNQSVAESGDTLTFELTLRNNGPQQATGIEIQDLLNYPLIYLSHSITLGTYNSGTGLWTGFNLNNNDSTTLLLTVVIDANFEGGLLNNETEVFSVDQDDIDSSPNNGITEEDDYSSSCVSVPMILCSDDDFQISISNTYSMYQWYESGNLILGANSHQLSVDNPGSYSVVVDDGILGDCGTQLCCPILVIEDNEAPVISCPAEITIECIDDLETAFSNLIEFESMGGNASDNCEIQSFNLISETIE